MNHRCTRETIPRCCSLPGRPCDFQQDTYGNGIRKKSAVRGVDARGLHWCCAAHTTVEARATRSPRLTHRPGSQTSRGQGGPETQSPRLMVQSTSRRWMSASTASSAGILPCMSAMTAIRIGLPTRRCLASSLSFCLHRCRSLPTQSDFLRQRRSRLCVVGCDQRVRPW
jgi:hypothetical protein